MIPRVFHQIWLGPDPLPEEFRRYRQSWTRRHPDWELRLWTEENLPAGLRRAEVYELLRQPAERADILRLELLHREGGVYVDFDVECLRPIDELLEDVVCFAGRLDSGRITNTILGSVSGHPFFERTLQEVRARTTYGPVDREGTGPLLLNRLLPEFPDVTVFETDLFLATRREDAVYAYHHAARSWKDAALLREDLRRAERKLLQTEQELGRVQRRHDLVLKEAEALRSGRFGFMRAALPRLRRLLRSPLQ